MAPAPWDAVASEDQQFVLVTGANSGIGLGIGQRLIDEFLAQHSLSSHLIVITTTRSAKKSEETTNALRKHLKYAAKSKSLRSRAGPSYDPQDTIDRVHLLSIQLDLCNLRSVCSAADKLVNGTISGSPGEDGEFECFDDVRIPRLDAVICNAGVGGWTGLDWPGLAMDIFSTGFVQATTFPICKIGETGRMVDPLTGKDADPNSKTNPTKVDRLLGQVFCANIFGHYVLAHELLPLLSRPVDAPIPSGRIIWESSVEAFQWKNMSMSDIQGIRTNAAYESSKRLTDVLALTANLPGVRAFSASYFSPGPENNNTNHLEEKNDTKPKMYIAHPGVVCTPLFPLHILVWYFYKLGLYLSRWLGSPWHPITPYNGACAPVWVALQPQAALDAQNGEGVKWGSSTSRWAGHTAVKKTEVEGWGWEGRVEDCEALTRDEAAGPLRKMVGRKKGAVDLTKERREEFEELGAECWKEMERLRLHWQGILRAQQNRNA